MANGHLIIICGLPGSGKTTLAKHLASQSDGIRMCPDDWMVDLGSDIWDNSLRDRIEQLQWKLAQNLLVAGNTVVVEWGTWAQEERDVLRNRARELNAAVELRFLDEPPEVLWERIRNRGLEQQLGGRAITRKDVDGWLESFQPPTLDELALYDDPAENVAGEGG